MAMMKISASFPPMGWTPLAEGTALLLFLLSTNNNFSRSLKTRDLRNYTQHESVTRRWRHSEWSPHATKRPSLVFVYVERIIVRRAPSSVHLMAACNNDDGRLVGSISGVVTSAATKNVPNKVRLDYGTRMKEIYFLSRSRTVDFNVKVVLFPNKRLLKLWAQFKCIKQY